MLTRVLFLCRLKWLDTQLCYYRTFGPLLIWCAVWRGAIKDICSSCYCLYRLLRAGVCVEKATRIIHRYQNIAAIRMTLSNAARTRQLSHDIAALADRCGIPQHEMRAYFDI